MSELAPHAGGTQDAEHSTSLTDRVLARVADARIAIDRRSSRPTVRRRRAARVDSAGEAHDRTPEVESLIRVFRDLGISYRQYRSQTRQPVKPELRDAAIHFRADPSLTSLVAVAAYLDELDLLT